MKLSEITSSMANLGNSSQISSEVKALGNIVGDNSSDYTSNSESFSSLLKQSLEDVNNSQVQAYKTMDDIATGKVENLQEAVERINEAELTLKLGLEVKNKALGAYKQIMSMQI